MTPLIPSHSRFFSSDSESSDEEVEERANQSAHTDAKNTDADLYSLFIEFLEHPKSSQFLKKNTPLKERFISYLNEHYSGITVQSTEIEALFQRFVETTPVDQLCTSFTNNQIVDACLQDMEKVIDSPVRMLRGRRIHQLTESIAKKLSAHDYKTPEYHYEALDNLGCIERPLINLRKMECQYRVQTSSAYLPVINLKHITEGEIDGQSCVGYHYLQGSISVQVVASNPQTGVCYGSFKLLPHLKEKFSTFYPSSCDSEEKLVQLITSSRVVAQNENSFLCIVEGSSLYIEKKFQDKGIRIQTAYPIFFCEHFGFSKELEITNTLKIPSEDILRLPSLSKDIKYTNATSVVVDVAPYFKAITQIEKGIYLIFNKAIFDIFELLKI